MSLPRNKLEGRQARKAAANLMRPATILGLILISIFALGAAITLMGYADEIEARHDNGPHVQSRSAIGFAGITQLRSAVTGAPTQTITQSAEARRLPGTISVFTPSGSHQSGDLGQIMDGQSALIILPKWRVIGMKDKPEWAQKTKGYEGSDNVTRSASSAQSILNALGAKISLETQKGPQLGSAQLGATTFDDLSVDQFQSFQTFDGTIAAPEFEDIMEIFQEGRLPTEEEFSGDEDTKNTDEDNSDEDTDSDGGTDEASKPVSLEDVVAPLLTFADQVVLVKLKGRDVFILSDPDFLNTQGIATQSRAELALNILETVQNESQNPDADFAWDLSIHGLGGTPNLVKLMTQPPFLAATLCLLGAGVLVCWLGFARFGDSRLGADALIAQRSANGGTALAGAAAELMDVSGRDIALGHNYAQAMRQRVIRELGLLGQPLHDINIQLSARETQRKISPRYDELEAQIRVADITNYTLTARAISAWSKEMIR